MQSSVASTDFFVPTPLFPTRTIRDSLGKDNVFYVKVYVNGGGKN